MTKEEKDSGFWPSVEELYKPSQPVVEKRSDEWEHNPNAKTTPGWVVPVLVLAAAALVLVNFIVLVQLPFIK